jgi:LPXTG-site transpeptidase (sortase) family protein
LIVFGCICVVVPIAIEAFAYPWFSSAVEDDLPDPPPPDFAVLTYDEYMEIKLMSPDSDIEEGIVKQDILPGGNQELSAWFDARGVFVTAEVFAETAVEERFQVSLPPVEVRQAETVTVTGNTASVNTASVNTPVYVLLGSVKIPRINMSENLFMGTGNSLSHGIGHHVGTPKPGQKGNSVIAAHRASSAGKAPFKHLDKMQAGDMIHLKHGDETFAYEVIDSFIANEHDLWVLQPSEDEPYLLTLVTCDPMYTLTRTEHRLIVRARLK